MSALRIKTPRDEDLRAPTKLAAAAAVPRNPYDFRTLELGESRLGGGGPAPRVMAVTRRPERVEFDAASDELRILLNRWDPLGVFHGEPDAPEDEYDCLIPGLFKRLRAGAE